MSVTFIFSNTGDEDCGYLRHLWKSLKDVNLVEINKNDDESVYETKTRVREALKKETDMVVLCGHGTELGLLSPDFSYYVFDSKDLPYVKWKKVVGIWCHASEFALMNELPGFFTSMFISNIHEYFMFIGKSIEQDVIGKHVTHFSKNVSNLIKDGVALEKWCEILKSEKDDYDKELTEFNYGLLSYYDSFENDSVVVEIINKSNNKIPDYATEGSSGVDLMACLEEDVVLRGRSKCVIPTGIYLSIPKGYEGQIRPRSGMAFRHGIESHLGTIDSDYRGEVKVLLFNHSDEDFVIKNGDRIAQMVFSKSEQVVFKEVRVLDKTERGEGGFGSTGR